jgi:hypothetical protein
VRPVVDGGTGGADAATARTNLSVHTEAEHSTFHADDDSIILGGRFTVLDTDVIDAMSDADGVAAFNTALSNFDTVYVRRTGSGLINWGNYNYTITIPQRTDLIGLGRGNSGDQYNYAPYFFLNGTSQRFFLYEGSSMQNFGFDLSNPSASNTTALIECQGGAGTRLLRYIRADFNGGGNRNHALIAAGATDHCRIEFCQAWAIPTGFSNQGILQSGGDTNNFSHKGSGVYYSAVIAQNTSKTNSGYGIRCYYGNVVGCYVYRTGDHGIYWLPSQGSSPTRIVDNYAHDCNGSGIYQGTSVGDTGWFVVSGNKAYLNGDHGIYVPYNRTSIFHGIVKGNYSTLNNQNVSGSANYLFGNSLINTINT